MAAELQLRRTMSAPQDQVWQAFTWQWDGGAQQTLVTADLTSTGADTDLLLTHSQFATEADRDNHVQGWSDCLDRLPAWLACRSQ